MNNNPITRRKFVTSSLKGSAVLAVTTFAVNLARPVRAANSPNNYVVLGLIGAGGRGQSHATGFSKLQGAIQPRRAYRDQRKTRPAQGGRCRHRHVEFSRVQDFDGESGRSGAADESGSPSGAGNGPASIPLPDQRGGQLRRHAAIRVRPCGATFRCAPGARRAIPPGSQRISVVAADGGNGNREDLANWVNAGFVLNTQPQAGK